MKIKKLIIENFKSFQKTTIIEFPDVSEKQNIFLIGGFNGAGKTTIMEAINICLYGAKQDFIFKNINRKEFRKENTNVCIAVFLETENLEIIEVKRSWRSLVVSNPKHKDIDEQLVIIKNGELVTAKSKDIWQDYINANFPKSITQFFFFDGEKIQEIAADDHPEIRLKSSLEAALGIQYISKLSKDLLHLKDEERKGYIDISDEDISFKESELRKEKIKLEKLLTKKADIQNELNSFKYESEECKKRFKLNFNTDIMNKREKKSLEKQKIELMVELSSKETQIKTLTAKYLPWGIAINLFDRVRDQIEAEKDDELSKILTTNIESLLTDIEIAFNEPTPLMNIAMDKECKKELSDRLIKIINQNQKNNDKILNLPERDIVKTLNFMEEIENSNIALLSIFLNEKKEIEDKIKLIENDFLSSLTDNEEELFNDLLEESENYQTQIGRQSMLLKNVCDEILQINSKIDNIEYALNELYKKHSISSEKRDFIKECEDISNLLKNYTIKLKENKIHHLQENTFKMYKLLSSKSELIKELIIDSNTYEISIFDRDGNEIKKSSLSAGEKEVFAISLLWGLAKTSQVSLPIIIDTPLSRLDSTHRDNIVKHYFPNAAKQIIILSTDTEVDDNYYKQLEQNLCGAGKLTFCHIDEFSKFQSGYFWK